MCRDREVDARHEGLTCLMRAAAEGNVGVVNDLLEHGANISLTVSEPDMNEDYDGDDGRTLLTGATPLMLAARYGLERENCDGGLAVVCLLLKHGANASDADARGETPLTLAAFHGNVEAIRELLAYGANIEAASASLLTAVAVGEYEAAKVLLDAGANPNSVNSSGWTVLMAAASGGGAKLVTLLLDRGADPNIRNKDGETALNVATRKNNAEAVDLLSQVTKAVSSPFPQRVK